MLMFAVGGRHKFLSAVGVEALNLGYQGGKPFYKKFPSQYFGMKRGNIPKAFVLRRKNVLCAQVNAVMAGIE